ncbi:glycosyltransferase family 4 protein [Rhodococcus pyridinivorans]|uniref:glycosyltransferase family 4 protein n=1 Tax=Rhodococcus pyridinivorans TaxID=103816 RepID=UPI003D7FDCA3
MLISVVHSFYSSDVPSGENAVVDSQIEALRNAGHDVELISKYTDSERDLRGYQARAALRAAGLSGPDPSDQLNRLNPDIVHVHNLFPNWSTRWVSKWSARLVATLHNYRPICSAGILWRDGHDCEDCLTHGSFSAIRHKCYRDSTVATLPLAYSSRGSGSHYPILRDANTLVVLNTRAEEIFRRLARGPKVELIPNFAAVGSSSADVVTENWVFVGRLTPEKGIPWLLRHWPRNKQLHIIGTGPLSSDVERAAAAEPERFRYLGQLDREHTQAKISSARGIVIPSLWSEGIPTVALEALQAGTPVIISERCSSAAQLTKQDAGKVFEIDEDGASLVAALDKAEGLGRAMRAAAKCLYNSDFSEAAWLTRMESTYARVIASRKRR